MQGKWEIMWHSKQLLGCFLATSHVLGMSHLSLLQTRIILYHGMIFMQSYSGELGTVPEPHTFVTWVFVSQPWFCDIQLFSKISINVKSPWGRESWNSNLTGEIFFLRWGSVEGSKRSDKQCNHKMENIRGRSWRKGLANENFLQVTILMW